MRADRSRNDARKVHRERGFGETAPKRGQWAALLPLPLILLDRFGGDSSGGFEGVSGLDACGGGGDGSPSLAGRDTDGEGDQEKRHDD